MSSRRMYPDSAAAADMELECDVDIMPEEEEDGHVTIKDGWVVVNVSAAVAVVVNMPVFRIGHTLSR